MEKGEYVIFDIFPHIFISELFLDDSKQMIGYLIFCERKYHLAESIDNILPGVKHYFKSQTDTINENEKSVKKVDLNIYELMKVIQSQNINGHITIYCESFNKHICNYKPPS